MLETSRLEVNVRRLLTRCELMAKEDSHFENWRLEKYILALDDMLKELQESPNKPSRDTIIEYVRRVDFLKGVIQTSKLTSPIERIVAAQMLPRNSSISTDLSGPSVTSQIHQKTTAKYSRELRGELFNLDGGTTGVTATDQTSVGNKVRQRLSSLPAQEQDLDALLKYNRNMQEKIAENMILMTSSMKEHALTANSIIKKDIGSLEKSDKLTDKNAIKLRTESLKLQEHTKSTWRCWVWLMVAFVFVVFFNMVLFMKMAKKKP